jgi:hypothetical protein
MQCGTRAAQVETNACSRCGAANPAGKKFCQQCGLALGMAAAPRPAIAKPSPPPARQIEFPAPPPSAPIATSEVETNALKACGIVFGAAAVLSAVGWFPLAMPGRVLGWLIPKGYCSDLNVQTPAMYACSMKVAVQTLVAPVLVLVAMFIMRKSIVALAQKLVQKLPPEYQFIGAPLIASTCFTMAWASVHYDSASLWGIVPQSIFPAVIALYTYCVGRYGPDVQNQYASLFEFRDKFPQWMRIAALTIAPLAVSLLITAQSRVSQTALKEQVVVILSLCAGYLVLAPRTGTAVSSMEAR